MIIYRILDRIIIHVKENPQMTKTIWCASPWEFPPPELVLLHLHPMWTWYTGGECGKIYGPLLLFENTATHSPLIAVLTCKLQISTSCSLYPFTRQFIRYRRSSISRLSYSMRWFPYAGHTFHSISFRFSPLLILIHVELGKTKRIAIYVHNPPYGCDS